MAGTSPTLTANQVEDRAVELLYWLAGRVREKRPQLCTEQAAFRLLFGGPPAEAWSPAHAAAVHAVAAATASMHVPGLGAVRLDAFIVEAGTRLPPDAHWSRVHYDADQWRFALRQAEAIGD